MLKAHFQVSSRRVRRGAVAVFTAVSLIMIVAFLAFAIDWGHITLTESKLQNAADAGALSAARELLTSREAVVAGAHEWAANNTVAGVPVNELAVQIGWWDDETATFLPLSDSKWDSGNAVRVTCFRSSERGNPLSLFFAPILGTDSADLRVSATASATLSCGGFVGIKSAEINSGFTDSYDSNKGPYGSQIPGAEGHLCSNSDITVKGTVNGDARPGEGYDVRVLAGGTVSGLTRPQPQKTYPPASAGTAATWNDNGLIDSKFWNGDKLSISSNKTETFHGGIIYASDLSISGEFIITGKTTIYVTGKADISGQGIMNTSQDPANLQIILLDQTGKTSTFSGSSNVYATIYGPGAAVQTTGSSSFFGGIIAGELKLTNSGGCHFDYNLKYNKKFSDTVKLVQ